MNCAFITLKFGCYRLRANLSLYVWILSFERTDPLKGQCHEIDMIFKGLNILISTFCVCAAGFQGLSKFFLLPYTIVHFLVAFLKLLTNFENAYWNPPQNSFSVIGQCSLVPTSHWMQGKCARTNLSQASKKYSSRDTNPLAISACLEG